ncbi:DUF192 domain-containing protein [Aquicoccus sp. SCR17]|nr:DUF192 domain-containing protein [Carideicomes alvinocaridis]
MAQAACREDSVTLRGEFGMARFRVDVADDAAERSRGLMFVKEMPASTGMLFVYPKAQPASFWMRNTLIPLDMLFMDATGTVTRIHENAVPLDETPIPGGDEVLAVLEINGGMAAAMGIEAGAQLRHPALPQDIAAWPCAE